MIPADGGDTLQTARVVADRGLSVSRCDTVALSSTHNIEDVLLSFPTLSLNSYGSSAGLKSFSLRGLGSAHSAIYIDGVKLSGVQSGQADIGLFEPLFFDRAVVDYAQNSLSLQSSRPAFTDSKLGGEDGEKGGEGWEWKRLWYCCDVKVISVGKPRDRKGL